MTLSNLMKKISGEKVVATSDKVKSIASMDWHIEQAKHHSKALKNHAPGTVYHSKHKKAMDYHLGKAQHYKTALQQKYGTVKDK